MSEENKGAEATPVDAGANDNDKGGRSVEYLERELKRLVGDRQSLKAKLDEVESKQKEAEASRLKETQRWEEAYNKDVPTLRGELETYKSKWTAFEEKLKARVAEKESKLTKESREEYEKFISKLDIEDRDEWLSKRDANMNTTSPASARTGTHGGLQKPVRTMEAKDRFESFAMDPIGFSKSI